MATGIPTFCPNCQITFPSKNQWRWHLPCLANDISTATVSSANTSTTATDTCKPPARGYRPMQLLSDGTPVTITISDPAKGQREYTILREYLTSVSGYFDNAFNGAFKEADSKAILLRDTSTITFAIFTEWLHGRRLLNSSGKSYQCEGEDWDQFTELLDIYIFADEYDVPQLRRDVMDTWIHYQGNHPYVCGFDVVARAFQALPSTSPLLRFLVDSYAWSYNGGSIQDRAELEDVPKEFLYDIMSKLMQGTAKYPYERLCDYHEHETQGKKDQRTEKKNETQK